MKFWYFVHATARLIRRLKAQGKLIYAALYTRVCQLASGFNITGAEQLIAHHYIQRTISA